MAGAVSVAPLLIGVIPFGLLFGAAAVDAGFTVAEVVGSSVIVFAGASQIAIVELLGDGATVLVAVATALMINLRMLVYSASLAPYFADHGRGERLGAAYLLTDQAYAVSVARYREGLAPRQRLAYYLGAGLTLWIVWQIATIGGALTGDLIPDDVPLEFAIPLVFLSLLIPVLSDRPAWVAAAVGAAASVVTAAAGLPEVAVIVGSVSGIAVGTFAGGPDPVLDPDVDPFPEVGP
jgi:predicted branched-subunit amino acid permease